MELRHLEQIVAICKAGSFSAAAEQLGISQPTLSRSIGRLEARLNVKLFDRTNTNARPTVYGRFVADQATALLEGVVRLGSDLEQLVRGEAGRLRIAAGPATRLKPVPQVIARSLAVFPGLQIAVTQAEPRAMVRGLRAGRFDVIFCQSEIAAAQDELLRVKIFEDRYVVVARPGNAALDLGPLSAAELLRFPLAGAGATPDFRRWLGPLDSRQKLMLEALVADDYDLIRGAALHGVHLARGPRFVFGEDLKTGALAEVPLEGDFPYECWMVTTQALWGSPIVKAVAGFARENGHAAMR